MASGSHVYLYAFHAAEVEACQSSSSRLSTGRMQLFSPATQVKPLRSRSGGLCEARPVKDVVVLTQPLCGGAASWIAHGRRSRRAPWNIYSKHELCARVNRARRWGSASRAYIAYGLTDAMGGCLVVARRRTRHPSGLLNSSMGPPVDLNMFQ